MLLRPKELELLRHKSTFDEDANEYKIPPFKLKDNEISLPTMKKVGYQVMEQEKENREMKFDDDDAGGTQENDDYRGYSSHAKIQNRARSRGPNQSREQQMRSTADRVKINERKSIHAPSKTGQGPQAFGSRQ